MSQHILKSLNNLSFIMKKKVKLANTSMYNVGSQNI
jgi:hypothetical protein